MNSYKTIPLMECMLLVIFGHQYHLEYWSSLFVRIQRSTCKQSFSPTLHWICRQGSEPREHSGEYVCMLSQVCPGVSKSTEDIRRHSRRTGATALSKTLRQRRLRLVGHALRMANPSPLTILLRFLQPGLRRRRGHARTLTLHQNIIDDISAINQSVKSITYASSSYFSRIVATLSTN